MDSLGVLGYFNSKKQLMIMLHSRNISIKVNSFILGFMISLIMKNNADNSLNKMPFFFMICDTSSPPMPSSIRTCWRESRGQSESACSHNFSVTSQEYSASLSLKANKGLK